MTLVTKRVASPVGELRLVASDIGLAAILWPNDAACAAAKEKPAEPCLVLDDVVLLLVDDAPVFVPEAADVSVVGVLAAALFGVTLAPSG